MLDKFIVLAPLQISPYYLILSGVFTVILFPILGVRQGNAFVLKFFAKLGFIIYSGKLKKDAKYVKKVNSDMVGFLKVPHTAYAPIFYSSGGRYKNHDFLGRKSRGGELFLDDSDLAEALKPLSRDGAFTKTLFPDLTIIKGSAKTTRTAKFSSLITYVTTDLKRQFPIIQLYEGGKVREFKLVFAVEMGISDRKPLDFTSREAFLNTLRRYAFYDSREILTSSVLILNGFTEIDSILLVLQEKEG